MVPYHEVRDKNKNEITCNFYIESDLKYQREQIEKFSIVGKKWEMMIL